MEASTDAPIFGCRYGRDSSDPIRTGPRRGDCPARGLLTRWIVALINARLDKTPQLGQRELEELARSNLQMLAIGRNLNQLTRAANCRTLGFEAVRAGLIEGLHAAVLKPAEEVSSVMTSNTGAGPADDAAQT